MPQPTSIAVSAALLVFAYAQTIQKPTPPPAQIPRSISGSVTDENGKPLANIQVGLARRTVVNGIAQYTWGPNTVTDARGQFTATGVRPGELFVTASAYGRKDGALESDRRAPAPIMRDGVRMGYVTTAYGWQGRPNRAITPLVVAAKNLTGIEIRLVRRPVYDIRGTVTGAVAIDALPQTITLSMSATDAETITYSRAATLVGNQFIFPELPDGTYVITHSVRPARYTATVVINGRQPDPVTIKVPGQNPRIR